MSTILLILYIVILVILLGSLAKMVKNVFQAIKNKNTPGIVYGVILLLVGIAIFIYLLDYKKILDAISGWF